ncbi:Uncharacterised protein [Raoultella planticola]|uniref:Lipoprotein n=1 Tax=Raoultella planticola TaxID=575 RepID=A0A485AWU9_RAOPL|nr:Uncharacterised protein [Raoultella planticola]
MRMPEVMITILLLLLLAGCKEEKLGPWRDGTCAGGF